jgi:NAD(P)-dependent dehydrogenase (short-subunit alcohol dehydrogenase family)
LKLSNKIAVITGGGRGFGKAIALAYAHEGADLVLVARTQEQVESVANEIHSLGHKAISIKCDVSSWDDVQFMVEQVLANFGRIDVLVNNAGRMPPFGPLIESEPDQWLETVAINLGGVYLCSRAVAPVMKRQGFGKIINISGGGATTGTPNSSAYGASKAAVVRLTETLAGELRDANVQVNAIAPGAIYTELTEDILRAGSAVGEKLRKEALQVRESRTTPKAGTELAVFLGSDDSINLTGRLISALWDDWKDFSSQRLQQIDSTDWYQLRRIVPPS